MVMITLCVFWLLMMMSPFASIRVTGIGVEPQCQSVSTKTNVPAALAPLACWRDVDFL